METLRQLIAFRNIVPLVTIILAFLGAGGFLQRLGFTTDQIILALLGVLAVDTIVERLGYLSRIEDSVKSISVTTSKPPFLSRGMLEASEPFERFVTQGRDVLMAGLTLTGTVGPFRTVFKKAVQQGTNLRFLLLDPESSCPELAAGFHGVSPESMRNDIRSSLSYLEQLADSISSNNSNIVHIRLLRTIPSASITMRDGNRDTGEIRYELYLYQTDVAGRPAFRLTPSDGEIYHRFRDAIERLWDDSQPWVSK